MIVRLGIFAIGVAVGMSILLFLDRPAAIRSEAMHSTLAQKTVSDGRRSSTQTAKPLLDGEYVDRDPEPGEGASSDGTGLAKDPIRIPSAYRELVGPIPRDRRSLSEVHAIFENEPRDEAWAVAMEVGIRDHYIRFGERENTVVEYVECRSRYCEIAGFREQGHRGIVGRVHSDMTKSGWWQANGGSYHISGRPDGIERFVIIISRYRIE